MRYRVKSFSEVNKRHSNHFIGINSCSPDVCMASDRGQNRYSDFVALGTLLRFENCSSSHRTVVFVASVPCLRVVASLVSSYCCLRGIVCCLRGVGSMSSSRRIPRFIVPYSSSFLCLRVVGSSFRRLR